MSFVDERRLLLRDFVGDEVVRTDILKAWKRQWTAKHGKGQGIIHKPRGAQENSFEKVTLDLHLEYSLHWTTWLAVIISCKVSQNPIARAHVQLWFTLCNCVVGWKDHCHYIFIHHSNRSGKYQQSHLNASQ
jgi:hypothetical protein